MSDSSDERNAARTVFVYIISISAFTIGIGLGMARLIATADADEEFVLVTFFSRSWDYQSQLFAEQPETFWRLISWPFEFFLVTSWTLLAITAFPGMIFAMAFLCACVGAVWGYGLYYLWDGMKELNRYFFPRTHQD